MFTHALTAMFVRKQDLLIVVFRRLRILSPGNGANTNALNTDERGCSATGVRSPVLIERCICVQTYTVIVHLFSERITLESRT